MCDDIACNRGYLIAYHYSPRVRRKLILREGLRIGAPPCVNGVEDDCRNDWISLSPTAAQAWWLSGEALGIGGFQVECNIWDLWEADIAGLDWEQRRDGYPEIKVNQDISADRLNLVGQRQFGEDST